MQDIGWVVLVIGFFTVSLVLVGFLESEQERDAASKGRD
jgi:hypothetical protein